MFKYNRFLFVFINLWNCNSNLVCYFINLCCCYVNLCCYNVKLCCNDDNLSIKWLVYKYIYIDLYNVSEWYIESFFSCMWKCVCILYINKVLLWNVFGIVFIDVVM